MPRQNKNEVAFSLKVSLPLLNQAVMMSFTGDEKWPATMITPGKKKTKKTQEMRI